MGPGSKAESLESPEPVDYTPPLGIAVPPGDYRQLYADRKVELEQRAATAKERIAAAYQQAQELKDARKAKMIDKLAPAKRQRFTSGTSRGQAQAPSSAFLHKPRADSRSSVLSKPGSQLKLLKDLGLVKPAARPATTVRLIKPSPVPSAATGHSSSLAGAALLSKATGGQLGRASVAAAGGPGGRHVEARPPLEAARAAAVAAARSAGLPSSSGSAAAAARSGFGAGAGSRSGSDAGASVAGSKRPAAPGTGGAHQPPAKASRGAEPLSRAAAGGKAEGGGPPKPDPRVMFPRQAPPGGSPLGGSKFAVPTARPSTLMRPAAAVGEERGTKASRPGGQSGSLDPLDDL